MVVLRVLYLSILFIRHNCLFILGMMHYRWLFFLNWVYDKDSQRQAVRLRVFLEKAGPVFIKLGQLLSTRVDILSDTYIAELIKLRDKASITNHKKVLVVIEKELRKSSKEKFLDISLQPIASASIAQVHKARLHTGEEVVIKLIKPKTQHYFKRDIALLRLIFSFVQVVSKRGRVTKPLKLVNHLEATMYKELDLRYEAASMDVVRENFVDKDFVYIPKVYWEYVTQNILVAEWIEGVNVNALATLSSSEYYDCHMITEHMIELFFTQVLLHGFFHGDLHSGNIIILKNNKICLIDFGIMGVIDPKSKKYLYELFTAFLQKDYKKAADIHFDMGWIQEKYNRHDFSLACRAIMEKVLYLPQKDIKLGDLLQQLFVVSGQFHMEIQENLLLLQKNLIYLENMGRLLSPNKNMWALTNEILRNKVGKSTYIKEDVKNFYEKFIIDCTQIKDSLLICSTVYKEQNEKANQYWKTNRLLIIVLAIFFIILICK